MHSRHAQAHFQLGLSGANKENKGEYKRHNWQAIKRHTFKPHGTDIIIMSLPYNKYLKNDIVSAIIKAFKAAIVLQV